MIGSLDWFGLVWTGTDWFGLDRGCRNLLTLIFEREKVARKCTLLREMKNSVAEL